MFSFLSLYITFPLFNHLSIWMRRNAFVAKEKDRSLDLANKIRVCIVFIIWGQGAEGNEFFIFFHLFLIRGAFLL